MFRPRTKSAAPRASQSRSLAPCSPAAPIIYFDRRETIALGAGDAVAANAIEQTNDPWPRNSGNRNLTFNGQRMQRAVECYRDR